jgi:putative flippase GtrA
MFSLLKKQVLIRLIKFALVGLSGAIINFITLFIFKEYILKGTHLIIGHIDLMLNLSMSIAVFASLLSNYYFHSIWTWSDRKNTQDSYFFKLIKYSSASIFGISIYFLGTNFLVLLGFNYIIAGTLSIGLASLFNFLINNKWAFKHTPL